MVTTMAKPRKQPTRLNDEEVTTVKCYRWQSRIITQIAAIDREPQQDVLARYKKLMEDDLLASLAKRQAELRSSRKEST